MLRSIDNNPIYDLFMIIKEMQVLFYVELSDVYDNMRNAQIDALH